MMDEAKIARINALAKKQKGEGLTDAEKEEQAALRQEYIAAVRENLYSQLERIDLVNPDGSIEHVKRPAKKTVRRKT